MCGNHNVEEFVLFEAVRLAHRFIVVAYEFLACRRLFKCGKRVVESYAFAEQIFNATYRILGFVVNGKRYVFAYKYCD